MTKDEFNLLLEMFRSISNSLAFQNKLIIEFIEDMRQYRTTRETRESEQQNTTQKLNAIINTRFGLLWWLLDKIAPGVGLALVLALLRYLKII